MSFLLGVRGRTLSRVLTTKLDPMTMPSAPAAGNTTIITKTKNNLFPQLGNETTARCLGVFSSPFERWYVKFNWRRKQYSAFFGARGPTFAYDGYAVCTAKSRKSMSALRTAYVAIVAIVTIPGVWQAPDCVYRF